MAGDWIKMRADLFTHPKVVRISSALKADIYKTVGGLMSAWCLFDVHSADGKLDGYCADTLDAHLRWPGFAAAMISVNWLISSNPEDPASLSLPEFDTHNGQSAKRRAMDANRKTEVRKLSALDADKKKTREEKRREEIDQEKRERDARAKADAAGDDEQERGESPPPPLQPSTGEPTLAGQACLMMKKAGCAHVNPSYVDLLAAIAEGVTPQALADMVTEAVSRGIENPFAYAITAARQRQAAGPKVITAPAGDRRSNTSANNPPGKVMTGILRLEDIKNELAETRTDHRISSFADARIGSTAGS